MKTYLQKFLITCAVFAATFLPILTIGSAYAYGPDNFIHGSATAVAAASPHKMGECVSFLGLTNWDCNVDIKDEKSLKTDIWKIVANVATDITVIAAYLVLGYVIYGGYLYIFSGGDPGKVATGKKALYHAFMGLAIVLSANIIMNTIRIALVGGSGDISQCATEGGCLSGNPGLMITNAIQWVVGIAGLIAAIFVVYGGISYTTSGGDPGKLQTAKRMIIYSLIGLIIVAIAEIITAFVSNMIQDANSTAILNETTISKEVTYENQA